MRGRSDIGSHPCVHLYLFKPLPVAKAAAGFVQRPELVVEVPRRHERLLRFDLPSSAHRQRLPPPFREQLPGLLEPVVELAAHVVGGTPVRVGLHLAPLALLVDDLHPVAARLLVEADVVAPTQPLILSWVHFGCFDPAFE